MAILNRSLSLPRITACLAASLFMVTINSGAQETEKKEKAEKTEKTENSTKTEKSGKSGKSDTVTARLSGDKQVPSVETKATGKSTIKVEGDKSVTGKVTVENMDATAAHIHQGGPDKDGPVVIPLKETAKNTFSVPPNTKMTDDQFAAFKDGNLYINVHSKKYPSGEVRAQMKP